LVEQDRLGRDRHVGFMRMVDIVQADGDEVARSVDNRAETRAGRNDRQRGRVDLGDRSDGTVLERFRGDVGDDARQIANRAVLGEKTGLLSAWGTEAKEFYWLFLRVGGPDHGRGGAG